MLNARPGLEKWLAEKVANGKFYEVAERPEVVDLTEEEAGAAEGADVGDVRSDSDEDSGGDEYVEEVAGGEENLSEFYLAKARRFAKYNKPKKMQG